MAQIKIYVASSGDGAADLLRLSRVRHALWKGGLVQGAPLGAHRDGEGRLFFRFRGNLEEVRAAVDAESQAFVEEVRDADADECVNCGNRPGDPFPTVCPNCAFRDITPCPNCTREVPRREYLDVAGNLFRCPHCNAHVRMEFNASLFDSSGRINEPAVVLHLETA